MDFAEIVLRLVGIFYAFAGYVATRAVLTSHFLDRAIAAISLKRPSRTETAQSMWLLTASTIILIGGIMLMLLWDLSAWVFLASTIGQAAYLFYVAPTYFDPEEPPDPRGRQQSMNAFVLFTAATALVMWGHFTGRLVNWSDIPWPGLAVAAVAVIAHVVHVGRLLAKPVGGGAFAYSGGEDDEIDPAEKERQRAQSKRIKVMADYDCCPLWALDEDVYGDFPPELLDLSPELTRDLNDWAAAYTSSLNREDPANSLWSDEEHAAHAAQARPLAARLARERPDRAVHVLDPEHGVVHIPPQTST